jgi:hypothetical protein
VSLASASCNEGKAKGADDFDFRGEEGVRKAGGRTLIFSVLSFDVESTLVSVGADSGDDAVAFAAGVVVPAVAGVDSVSGPERDLALVAKAASSSACCAPCCRILSICSDSALSRASIIAAFARTRCRRAMSACSSYMPHKTWKKEILKRVSHT